MRKDIYRFFTIHLILFISFRDLKMDWTLSQRSR